MRRADMPKKLQLSLAFPKCSAKRCSHLANSAAFREQTGINLRTDFSGGALTYVTARQK